MTDPFASPGRPGRAWPRHPCGSDGAMLIDGRPVAVTMVDASRGGFKLRFQPEPAILAFLGPPPRDINVVTTTERIMPATVLWLRDGLAGCRFVLHTSLDDVAELMTTRFELRPPRTG